MPLNSMLGPITAQCFLDEYYLKLPFARAAGAEALVSLATWDRVLAIVDRPDADVIVSAQGQRWSGDRRNLAQQARGLLDAGHTIGIRHAELYDADLAQFAAEFKAELAGDVNIHVYCTPAGQVGFGWHYDAEEVFVIQTSGSKEWLLRKNTVNPWPLIETLPADMRYEREIMPVMQCRLQAGHWLYIPSGYWHRTQAGEESISLSVGVTSVAALDVLDFLRSELRDSLFWRQRLPNPGRLLPDADDDRRRAYRAAAIGLADELRARLADPAFADRFLEQRTGADS